MIHLQGMGVIGCLIALQLEERKIDFTWNDIDAKYTAWKASTGSVQPTGDPEEMEAMRWWLNRTDESPYNQFVEVGHYCYSSNEPPHKGKLSKVTHVAKAGGVKVSNMPSVHVNPQLLVETVRKRLIERMEPNAKGDPQVIAHGFSRAIHRWSWGWSTKVEVELSPQLKSIMPTNRRGCFYLRRGYQMSYIYPCPGTKQYYAGSSMITQKYPHEFDPEPKFKKWLSNVEKFSEGHITPTYPKKLEIVQGWRPMPKEGMPYVVRKGSVLYTRPMYGDGLRRFPLLWEALRERLGIAY